MQGRGRGQAQPSSPPPQGPDVPAHRSPDWAIGAAPVSTLFRGSRPGLPPLSFTQQAISSALAVPYQHRRFLCYRVAPSPGEASSGRSQGWDRDRETSVWSKGSAWKAPWKRDFWAGS